MIRFLPVLFAFLANLAFAGVPPIYEGQMAAGCSPVITFKHTDPSVSGLCGQFLSDLQGPANNCPTPTPAGNVSLTGSTEQRCYFHGTNEQNNPWDVAAIISKVCSDGSAIQADGTCNIQCRADMVNGPAGCQCPNGQTDNGNKCVVSCEAGYHNGGIDMALCLPDCFGNQIQQADGSCRCDRAVTGVFQVNQSAGLGVCNDGCQTNLKNPGVCNPFDIAKSLAGKLPTANVQCYFYGSYNGETCGTKDAPRIPAGLKPAPAMPSKFTGSGPVAPGTPGGGTGTGTGTGGTGGTAPGSEPTADPAKIVVKETSTWNIDSAGNKTTSTEKTVSVTDPQTGNTTTTKSTSSTTTNSSGATTGTTSGGSTGTGTGGGGGGTGGDGDGLGECALEPNTPMCRKAAALTEKGKFDNQDPKLLEAKQALTNYFEQVKSEAATLFTPLSGGGGSLPCPAPIVVLGKSVQFCVSNYSNQVSPLGAAVMLMAALGALFIVFKR